MMDEIINKLQVATNHLQAARNAQDLSGFAAQIKELIEELHDIDFILDVEQIEASRGRRP